MSRGGKLTRGDPRRNERLSRLRSLVRRDFAVLGVDLASGKQAAVLTDHDSVVLARRMFTGDAWEIEEILDWAAPIATEAGFAGIVLECEPTGHRWKPLLDGARARGIELVCVNPMLVHRGREEEDFTRHRSDFKDATIIAKRVSELRCYVPYQHEGHGPGCVILAPAVTSRSCWPARPASACVTCSNAPGQPCCARLRTRWTR